MEQNSKNNTSEFDVEKRFNKLKKIINNVDPAGIFKTIRRIIMIQR